MARGGRRSGAPGQSRQTAYDRAVRLMQTNAARAFDLDAEPAKLRDRYGRNLFGQGCLLARRLVEQGVPFIEVTLDRAGNPGWSPILWCGMCRNPGAYGTGDANQRRFSD